MSAGVAVRVADHCWIDAEFRGRKGRVAGVRGRFFLVDLGDETVGFTAEELVIA